MGRRKYWPIYEACAETRPAHHVARLRRRTATRSPAPAGRPSTSRTTSARPRRAGQRHQPGDRGRLRALPDAEARLGRERLRLDALADVADGRGLDAAAQRGAAPQAAPSEYIREHCLLDASRWRSRTSPSSFLQLLEHFGDMVDHILFATDYPHWDWRRAGRGAAGQLPGGAQAADLLRERARALRLLGRRGRAHEARRRPARTRSRPAGARSSRSPAARSASSTSTASSSRCATAARTRAARSARASSGACCEPTCPASSSTSPARDPGLPLARLGVRRPHRPVLVRAGAAARAELPGVGRDLSGRGRRVVRGGRGLRRSKPYSSRAVRWRLDRGRIGSASGNGGSQDSRRTVQSS